jgi:hypothetical protein
MATVVVRLQDFPTVECSKEGLSVGLTKCPFSVIAALWDLGIVDYHVNHSQWGSDRNSASAITNN